MPKKRLRALLLTALAAVALSTGLASSASAGNTHFCDRWGTGSYQCWDFNNHNVQYISANSDHAWDTLCNRLYNNYYGWLFDHYGRQEVCAGGNPAYIITQWDGLYGQAWASISPVDGASRHFTADSQW